MTRDSNDEPRARVGGDNEFGVNVCAGFYVVNTTAEGKRVGICLIPRGKDDGHDNIRKGVAQRIAQLLNAHGLVDLSQFEGVE